MKISKGFFGYTDYSLPSKYLIVRFWNWLCYRCYYKHIWQFKLRKSSKKSQKEYESTLEGLRNFNPTGFQETARNTSYNCHLRNRIVVL